MFKCTNIDNNAVVPKIVSTIFRSNQYNCNTCGDRARNIVPNPYYLTTENQSNNYIIFLLAEDGCHIRA